VFAEQYVVTDNRSPRKRAMLESCAKEITTEQRRREKKKRKK